MTYEGADLGPAWRPERKHLVVCVDDEIPVLASLRLALWREPYEFRTTREVEQALAWLETEDVSVFIADNRMPQMSGTDLLKTVHERSPGTARVMLTGCPDRSAVIERRDLLIERLITKPWINDELRRTILNLLQGHELDELRSTILGLLQGPECDETESP